MLTLKLITEERERVIKGLEKKHFANAEEAINEVMAVDKKRRETQQELDANLSEQKKAAAFKKDHSADENKKSGKNKKRK